MPDEDLIDSTAALEILGIDRSTLSRWVAAGRIEPVTRVGAGFVFRASDVRRLRAERSTPEAAS